MLDFSQSKQWYEENKEFLRIWEMTKCYKDYRNIREKTRRSKVRISYLQNILDNIPNKKTLYLSFFYEKLRKLKEKHKKLIQNQEKAFNIMRKAKSKAEIKFLKQKLSNLTKVEGIIKN